MSTDPHTSTSSTPAATQELKQRHRAMWALGDYPSVAAEVIGSLGQTLVDAVGIRPGERVLDVAAGSGNASLPAARAGAEVVASDLTPELLEVGRRLAAADGLELAWDEGDAEDLPYPDASFDVVLSCVGVMFAPFHERSASELLRVLRPGGRVGLISWTPEGFIGQMFATMRPFAPAPPPGATPPVRWGDETHLRHLLGDAVEWDAVRRDRLGVDTFDRAEAFRDFFKERYGPTVAAYRSIADEPERVQALDDALAGLAGEHLTPEGTMDWEYLVATGRRTHD